MPEKAKVVDWLEHRTSLIHQKGCVSLNDPAVQNLEIKACYQVDVSNLIKRNNSNLRLFGVVSPPVYWRKIQNPPLHPGLVQRKL